MSSRDVPPGVSVGVGRLVAVNALIRIAAAASGQLFAFALAERTTGSIPLGSAIVGLLGASFFVTELLGAPVAGRLADRWGQRRVLRYGPVMGILSATLAASAAQIGGAVLPLTAVLLAARITEGSSAACAVPTTLTLLARATAGDAVRRTRVMGFFEIASLLGMIVGYIVAGVGWDALGVAAFLLLPPLYLMAWWLVPSGEEPGMVVQPPQPILRTVRHLAALRGAVPFAVAWLAVNAVVGLWMQYAPYLFKLKESSSTQRLVGGFSGQAIGGVFAGWGLTFLLGLALWSLFGGRIPRRRVLGVALVGMLGVVTTLTFVNHGAPVSVMVLGGAFVMVESGFTPAAFAHLADLTEGLDASRGSALGLYSLILGAGQLAGNIVGAPFVARWQMDGVLLATALLATTALAGVSLMGATSHRVSALAEPRKA